MKQWLPIALKNFLWNIFKSPERKIVGGNTLFTDINARMTLLFKNIFSKQLQPVSICIGIKDRSEHLLQYCLPSLNKIKHPELVELSIFDAGSTDIHELEKSIRAIWKGALTYRTESMSFARSVCFNRAIAQSSHALILACDADMEVPKDIVEKVNRYTSSRSAWFPKIWWLNDDLQSGRYFTEGTGIFASLRTSFDKTGKYDEDIKEWGKEDWLLYFAFYRKGIACIRTNEKEFVHRPHPSMKPEGYRNLF